MKSKHTRECRRNKDLELVFPACTKVMGSETWRRISSNFPQALSSCESFLADLPGVVNSLGLPAFIPDLALIEFTIYRLKKKRRKIEIPQTKPTINPTLELLELSFKGLVQVLEGPEDFEVAPPIDGREDVLVWEDLRGHVRVEVATDENLLVLKMVEEGIDPRFAANKGKLPVGAIETALYHAASKGLICMPRSKIKRDSKIYFQPRNIKEDVLTANIFTLQWHITQQCDLNCKHCYDRSKRSPLKLERALLILEEFYEFCKAKHVRGQISFTGGNPFLYAHFYELYSAANDYGFRLAILGNPVTRLQIEKILDIQMPEFYQVSLEGLKAHNDEIRGNGHFDRTMEFLAILKELGIYSMVMLTLTKDNMKQVLPLGRILKDKSDLFTFNRLAKVGEGSNLDLPSPHDYKFFLEDYIKESECNPVIALKDNLINAVFWEEERQLFGGCTGYGCGAAFNFLALLPDGEVHACRKFPSFLGNINEQSLMGIYESPKAEKYRSRPEECKNCPVHPVCGGCLAVTHSFGLDISRHRDPFCFFPLIH